MLTEAEREYVTYEWFCQGCGVTTLIDQRGGELGCKCPKIADGPTWDWSEEEKEQARKRSEHTHIFTILSGRREYLGTAQSFCGTR